MKISGASVIVRVHEVQMDRTKAKRLAFHTTKQPPIQIEQHLPFSGVNISMEVSEPGGGVLHLRLKRDDTGQLFKTLTFDRKAKRIQSETR